MSLFYCLSFGQTQTIPYQGFTYADGYATTTLSNITTCQVSVVLETASQVYTGIWEDGYYDVIVNGTYIDSYFGSQTIDLSSYVPINSVYVESLYGSWGWTHAKLIVTSNSSSTPASGPTVSNVTYCQNQHVEPPHPVHPGPRRPHWYTGDEWGDVPKHPSACHRQRHSKVPLPTIPGSAVRHCAQTLPRRAMPLAPLLPCVRLTLSSPWPPALCASATSSAEDWPNCRGCSAAAPPSSPIN